MLCACAIRLCELQRLNSHPDIQTWSHEKFFPFTNNCGYRVELNLSEVKSDVRFSRFRIPREGFFSLIGTVDSLQSPSQPNRLCFLLSKIKCHNFTQNLIRYSWPLKILPQHFAERQSHALKLHVEEHIPCVPKSLWGLIGR